MKPEHKTYLRDTELVEKTDIRIALRGALDTLHSEVLLLQTDVLYTERNLAEELESVSHLLRDLLLFEKIKMQLEDMPLFGERLEDWRALSHQSYQYMLLPTPPYKMDSTAARLNKLRAQTREVELIAAHVYTLHPTEEFEAVQYALNRVSSSIYVKFCARLTHMPD